ncbi:MAG: class I SAM-dependent methyltransferase [Pseudomonadota bacterium]
MCPAPAALAEISERTVAHYERNAASFWEGTRDHDVSQNIATLLRHLPGAAPCRILDLGCGPGRDLETLRQLGHDPIGLEACPAFVAMARQYSGCEVWQQDFLRLELPAQFFDGIFANASLFHVPKSEIRRVLGELRASLRPAGVLFSSNPRGRDEEGWSGERFGVWWHEDSWRRILEQCGFVELETYYRPAGLPREQQPWFAGAWRKGGEQDGKLG